jgi:phosphohistidine phosphatase
MRIVLFRHGPAGKADPERWPDDRRRPLTARGRTRTAEAARGLRRLVSKVDAIYASPLARAAETAALVAEVMDQRAVETLDALAPGRTTRGVVAALARHGGSATLVLVGHEPDLGLLAGNLVEAAALPLKKAGACAIDCDGRDVGPGLGRLRWFLPPSVLCRLGRAKERA